MILFWLGSIWCFHSSSTDESLLVLSGLSSFSDALEWKPSKGTQFRCRSRNTILLVAVKQNLGISGILLTAMDASGAVIVDVVHEDFQTNQYLKEVASGQTHTLLRVRCGKCILTLSSAR